MKSIRIDNPQYHECMALIEQEGTDRLYVVSIDRELMTLPGHTMRGFLVASDVIDWFMRF